MLGALRREGVALGVVTNCSEQLAAERSLAPASDSMFIVTAERAGYYKLDAAPIPDGSRRIDCSVRPMPLRSWLRLRPVRHQQCRSAHILARPHRHDAAANAPEPIAHHRLLYPLLEFVRPVE